MTVQHRPQMPRRARCCPEDLAHETRVMRQIWCAVLVQAIRDLSGRAGKVSVAERTYAQNWIGSRDFVAVCELAGVHPQRAEAALRAMISRRTVTALPALMTPQRQARHG